MTSVMDLSALAGIEKQRLQLEENIAQLRKSLRHWLTLEIDYEGLKEEFLALPQDASLEDCLQAAQESKADLVDEKELRSLLTSGGSRHRQPQQVVELLTKRVDYVSRNVETIRKQLSDAEKKRNALLLAEEPEHREDAGLPLTEITEELDETGQVISTKIHMPGADAPQLIDVLKRAGVHDLHETGGTITRVETAPGRRGVDATMHEEIAILDQPPAAPKFDQQQQGDNQEQDGSSINDVVKVNANATLSKPRSTSTAAVNPNDTEEEAVLRQEMIEYGLDEVGAIVAELDLQEDASDISYDEGDDNFEVDSEFEDEFENDMDEDESEDETGKANRLAISSKYRRKMEELEKKLGLKVMENLGPTPDLPPEVQAELDRPPAAEAAGKAAIARHEATGKSSMKNTQPEALDQLRAEPKKKKKVTFSQTLDIAQEDHKDVLATTNGSQVVEPKVKAVGDVVVERTNRSDQSDLPQAPAPPVKTSKFKSARLSTPQTPMFPPPMDFAGNKSQTSGGPPGKLVADAVIERPTVDGDSTAAPDPNDIDEEIHRREIATEFYRMRNRRIHEQGGFVGEGEADNYGDEVAPPLMEDESTGKVRKVSRFKAARIKS